MSTGTTLAQKIWRLPITFELDLRPVPWKEFISSAVSLVKSSCMAQVIPGPTGKPITVVLLNEHVFKLPSERFTHID